MFFIRYKTEFGFTIDGRQVIVDDIRVRGLARTGIQTERVVETASTPPAPVTVNRATTERLKAN